MRFIRSLLECVKRRRGRSSEKDEAQTKDDLKPSKVQALETEISKLRAEIESEREKHLNAKLQFREHCTLQREIGCKSAVLNDQLRALRLATMKPAAAADCADIADIDRDGGSSKLAAAAAAARHHDELITKYEREIEEQEELYRQTDKLAAGKSAAITEAAATILDIQKKLDGKIAELEVAKGEVLTGR